MKSTKYQLTVQTFSMISTPSKRKRSNHDHLKSSMMRRQSYRNWCIQQRGRCRSNWILKRWCFIRMRIYSILCKLQLIWSWGIGNSKRMKIYSMLNSKKLVRKKQNLYKRSSIDSMGNLGLESHQKLHLTLNSYIR